MSPPAPCLVPVSELEPCALEWLWPGRLAQGKLAIYEGDPGLGKSLLALDLCARLSTGRPMPDGSPGPGTASAIVVNGEDGDRDTVRPRLQALGADLQRVFIWHRQDGGLPLPLQIPGQLQLVDEALTQSRAQLLVLDPVVAFLERGIHPNDDQGVRRALFPLAKLAEKHGCAVLLLRHLNKKSGGQSVYRGGGTIGLLGACRSGWLVARDPEAPERCVLAQVKNNLAPPQPSLAYTVLERDGVLALSWLGPARWTADQLLAGAARAPASAAPRDRAREFLTTILSDGPRTSREIWAAAQEEGLSERTLFRAKQGLEIRTVRVATEGSPVSYWLLPGQQVPAGVAPPAGPADLEPWLAPLRAKYPPRTPLDDL